MTQSHLEAIMSNLLDIPEDKKRLVDVILKTTDLYKVIHVTRDATTAEISKQYKKVSVRVHPDKNEHPKSADAFKKVGEAKRILTDESARRRYDQTGSTSDRPEFAYASPFGGGGYRGGGGGPFGDDIFEAFFRAAQQQQQSRSRRGRDEYNPFGGDPFGGAFGGGRGGFFYEQPGPQFRTRQASSRGDEESGFRWVPLALLLALFIGLTFFSTRLTAEPAKDFSLWKSADFSVPHHTVDGLPFWLEPGKFTSETLLDAIARRNLDHRVTDAWKGFKQAQCSQDLSQAKRANAPSRPTSCADLDRINAMGRRS